MDEEEKPSLSSELRNLTERERQALKDHPTPEQLVAYRAGELPEEEQERLRDHLAVCRDCAALLLDLADFGNLKPPAGVPELTDAQVDQAWQSMRSRIAQEDTPEAAAVPGPAKVVPLRPVPPALPARVETPARSVWPRAAVWFLIAGLGILSAVLANKLQDRTKPTDKVAVAHLSPEGDGVRGGGEARPKPPLSQDEDLLLIFLRPFDAEPYTSYRAQILDQEGKNRYEGPVKSERGQDPMFKVPSGFLAPGDYCAQLSGSRNGQWQPLERYSFQIE